MNNADIPAMTTPHIRHPSGQIEYGCDGLTKREYFAAMAMQRIHAADVNGAMGPDITAQAAVLQADALLAALERSP